MENYKEMYFNLAGKVADAVDLLVKAQQEGEDSYLNVVEIKEDKEKRND